MGNSGIHALGFFPCSFCLTGRRPLELTCPPHRSASSMLMMWVLRFRLYLHIPQVKLILPPTLMDRESTSCGAVKHHGWVDIVNKSSFFRNLVKTAPLHTVMYLLVFTITLPTLTQTKRLTVYSSTESALIWSSSLYRLTVFGWT